MLNMMG